MAQSNLFLHCDNYEHCNSCYLRRATDAATEAAARAKGWHFWRGTTLSGDMRVVTLCHRCTESRRRGLPPVPEQRPGQLELFDSDEES